MRGPRTFMTDGGLKTFDEMPEPNARYHYNKTAGMAAAVAFVGAQAFNARHESVTGWPDARYCYADPWSNVVSSACALEEISTRKST